MFWLYMRASQLNSPPGGSLVAVKKKSIFALVLVCLYCVRSCVCCVCLRCLFVWWSCCLICALYSLFIISKLGARSASYSVPMLFCVAFQLSTLSTLSTYPHYPQHYQQHFIYFFWFVPLHIVAFFLYTVALF